MLHQKYIMRNLEDGALLIGVNKFEYLNKIYLNKL